MTGIDGKTGRETDNSRNIEILLIILAVVVLVKTVI